MKDRQILNLAAVLTELGLVAGVLEVSAKSVVIQLGHWKQQSALAEEQRPQLRWISMSAQRRAYRQLQSGSQWYMVG